MGDDTRIEWTDATWNPVRGCSRVSEGCRHCYAERVAARFSGPGMPYEGLAADGKWTGKVRLVPEKCDVPLRWTKPRRIFVNSMSDLFHEKLSGADIDRVFEVMSCAPRHTFQVLTKRPEIMLRHLRERVPLPNVWLGVSCEDQKAADRRIQLLLQTPAAVHFVSAEPLLGPLDLGGENGGNDYLGEPPGFIDGVPELREEPGIDWVIVGGESGPGARRCDVAWVRSIVNQCREAGTACFVKQLGAAPVMTLREWNELPGPRDRWTGIEPAGTTREDALGIARLLDRKGGDPSEWPEDLRVREFPKGVSRG